MQHATQCNELLVWTLINTYRAPVRLFITGSGKISSTKGTTQGDRLAMAMYALAITPLIDQLRASCQVHQAWYADDATGASTCRGLIPWWNELADRGPSFGGLVDHPNASKTYLVVKREYEGSAKRSICRHIYTHNPWQTTPWSHSRLQNLH